MLSSRALRLRPLAKSQLFLLRPTPGPCIHCSVRALQRIQPITFVAQRTPGLDPSDFEGTPDFENEQKPTIQSTDSQLRPDHDPRSPRKREYQEAWNSSRDEGEELASKKLYDPRHIAFIPGQRRYPRERTQRQWMQTRKDRAWALIVEDRLREKKGYPELPTFQQIMKVARELAGMSKGADGGDVAAMRVILPPGMKWEIGDREVGFVDSKTGMLEKLKMGPDQNNPSAGIIFRGTSESLARVAEELVGMNKDIQIFQLGDVASFDYQSRQLWPVLPTEHKTERSLDGWDAKDKSKDSVWVHTEAGERVEWDGRLDEIPLPEEWTTQTFHDYVMALMTAYTPPFRVRQIYKGHKPTLVDEQIKMLLAVYRSPKYAHLITPGILNNTLSWFQSKGGHRRDAEEIFSIAKRAGVPVDTSTYNIILDGYTKVGDIGHFFATLIRMKRDFIPMNNRTWLLLLQLVQNDKYRREVVLKMLNYGVWDGTAERRHIASIMAGYDLHHALNRGIKLSKFMDEQAQRYGKDWFTKDAAVEMVNEYLMFHRWSPERMKEVQDMIDRPSEDGIEFNAKIGQELIKHARKAGSWDLALWTLDKYKSASTPLSVHEFSTLLRLAEETVAPHALAILIWHGTLVNGMWPNSRMNHTINQLFLGDPETVNPAWREFQPRVMDVRAERQLNSDFPRILRYAVFGIRMAIRAIYYAFQPKHHLADDLRRVYYENDVAINEHMQTEPDKYDLRWKANELPQGRWIKGGEKAPRRKVKKERLPDQNSNLVKEVTIELVQSPEALAQATKLPVEGLKEHETIVMSHEFKVPLGYVNVRVRDTSREARAKRREERDEVQRERDELDHKVVDMHR